MPLTHTQPDALARTYAHSLYDLAHAQGGRAKVEETLGELEDVLELARRDAKFGEFLSSRSLGVAARKASLTRIFKGRVSDLTLHFLLVLNAKGRINVLSGILAAFDSIVQTAFGRVEVDVFTAQPLPADALDGIRGRLSATLGKDVIVHPYTEPAMIGGVKFRIGDRLIDGSIATRLRQVKDRLHTDGAAAMRARLSRILEN